MNIPQNQPTEVEHKEFNERSCKIITKMSKNI